MQWLHLENVTVHISFPVEKQENLNLILGKLQTFECKMVKYTSKQDKNGRVVDMYVRFNTGRITEEQMFRELNGIEGLNLEKFE